MESKNLIIAFVWTFVLVSTVILSLEGFGMSFVGYMIFFFIALVSTVAVEIMIPDKKQHGSELLNELQDIRSRLDEITKGSVE
jgi:archaellum biogenesis protein FlaJ (TadC family)